MKKLTLIAIAIGAVAIFALSTQSCKKNSTNSNCSTITVTVGQIGNVTAAGATATGGTSPYTWNWSTTPAQTSNTATGLTAGSTYTVTVTDKNGCTGTGSIMIAAGSSAVPTLYDTIGAVGTGAFNPTTGGTVMAGVGSTMVADPLLVSTTGGKIQVGELVMRDVVDSAIFIVAADDSCTSYFTVLLADMTNDSGGVGTACTGFQNLQTNLVNFFCSGTGAPSTGNYAITYSGSSMQVAHSPTHDYRISHSVTVGGFNAFVADIVASAQKNGVANTSPIVGSLGKILLSLESSVVNQP